MVLVLAVIAVVLNVAWVRLVQVPSVRESWPWSLIVTALWMLCLGVVGAVALEYVSLLTFTATLLVIWAGVELVVWGLRRLQDRA